MLKYLGTIDALKTYLLGFGPWTPAVYFILQMLQVILAPLPGGTTTLIGGALFGGLWGTVISSAAVILGSCAVFALTKRLGRPFVVKFSHNSPWIEKFESIHEDKMETILFLIFIFPAFPDDLICFVAGLTKIPFRRFLLLCVVGRTPGILLNTLIGAGIMSDNPTQLIIFVAIYAVFIVIFLLNTKRLSAYIEKHRYHQPEKGTSPHESKNHTNTK